MARRNLETAPLLFDVNHYTDVIAVDIQQTIEKTFKALHAFYGVNIPGTHALEHYTLLLSVSAFSCTKPAARGSSV